jgi:hypothetical protein
VRGEFEETFAASRAYRYWQARDAASLGVVQHRVNKSQASGTRMLDWPATKAQHSAPCRDPPELRTAHSAGGAKRINMHRLALGRVTTQDLVNLSR